MSTRVITSPGIEINEIDESLLPRTTAGTTVFMTGFASQGPTEELLNITSLSEYESTYGVPTNESERYLYHSAKQVLQQSPGNLLVSRMPYGSGGGIGYSNLYSALVFPISASIETVTALRNETTTLSTGVTGMGGEEGTVVVTTYGAITGYSATYTPASSYEVANHFTILSPQSVLLTEEQYLDLVSNNINWTSSYNLTDDNLNSYATLLSAGLIVINNNKSAINNLYEGSYIALADNSNNNPATDFDCVTGIKTPFIQLSADKGGYYQALTGVPNTRLGFRLNHEASSPGSSLSQTIEQYPTGYDFGNDSYNDCLTLAHFKLKTSIYAQDTVTLTQQLAEGYTGSLNSNRTQNNINGGLPGSFALERLTNLNSSTLKVIVNPLISNVGKWTNIDGSVGKKVRVSNAAKNLYALGVYEGFQSASGKDIGHVPTKLARILDKIDNLEIDIDLIPEAGLGTIWSGAYVRTKANLGFVPNKESSYYYDETLPVGAAELAKLKAGAAGDPWLVEDSDLKLAYNEITSLFLTFAEKNRKDHMFILDPLKYILINGPDTKVTRNREFNFSRDVYWPLKNTLASVSTSYGAVYGNWIKATDNQSNMRVWVPSSGYAAAAIASSSAQNYPWSAPAGFSRGVLGNVLDLAINPTQKQRDQLYKINVNPIALFPGDGYVIFGQKTLFNKPSAFDRINVRRLFLALEKQVKMFLKYFVFEPNTFMTRARLVDSLLPMFKAAKNSDGVYDFKIICDERNNTPDVIDNNELRIAIYIQPVRTAEFILADFHATRTGINFDEITS